MQYNIAMPGIEGNCFGRPCLGRPVVRSSVGSRYGTMSEPHEQRGYVEVMNKRLLAQNCRWARDQWCVSRRLIVAGWSSMPTGNAWSSYGMTRCHADLELGFISIAIRAVVEYKYSWVDGVDAGKTWYC